MFVHQTSSFSGYTIHEIIMDWVDIAVFFTHGKYFVITSSCFQYANYDTFLAMQRRVAAIFVFVSFTSLLGVAGVPSQLKEIKVMRATYLCFLCIMHKHASVKLIYVNTMFEWIQYMCVFKNQALFCRLRVDYTPSSQKCDPHSSLSSVSWTTVYP